MIRPVRADSPARRSSPASSGAEAQVTEPTSVPTTRSPTLRSVVSPPPTPMIIIWPNERWLIAPACRAARVVPYPVRRTSGRILAAPQAPRPDARASIRSGAQMSGGLVCSVMRYLRVGLPRTGRAR